jgi:putative transposase
MTKLDPFKYSHSSREIIRLAVMMYVRYPLSPSGAVSARHKG